MDRTLFCCLAAAVLSLSPALALPPIVYLRVGYRNPDYEKVLERGEQPPASMQPSWERSPEKPYYLEAKSKEAGVYELRNALDETSEPPIEVRLGEAEMNYILAKQPKIQNPEKKIGAVLGPALQLQLVKSAPAIGSSDFTGGPAVVTRIGLVSVDSAEGGKGQPTPHLFATAHLQVSHPAREGGLKSKLLRLIPSSIRPAPLLDPRLQKWLAEHPGDCAGFYRTLAESK